jgi:hypothetical protein
MRSYWSRSGRIITLVGLLLGVPSVFAAYIATGSIFEKVLLMAITVGITTVILAAAWVRGWRTCEALRYGQVARGQVLKSTWLGPGIRPPTIDAQTSGIARGTWRIQHPLGGFEATFESDAPWASKLVPGTAVRTVVHPTRRKVLLDLGPDDR